MHRTRIRRRNVCDTEYIQIYIYIYILQQAPPMGGVRTTENEMNQLKIVLIVSNQHTKRSSSISIFLFSISVSFHRLLIKQTQQQKIP